MKVLILCILAVSAKSTLSDSALDKNNEALSRQKRVSVEGADTSSRRLASANAQSREFPIRMPYYTANNTDKVDMSKYNCQLYMEGITIVGINQGKESTGGQKAVFAIIAGTNNATKSNKFLLDQSEQPSQVTCNVKYDPKDKTYKTILNGSDAEFTVGLDLSASGGVQAFDGPNNLAYTVKELSFTLHFTVPSLDNWYLDRVHLNQLSIEAGSTNYLPTMDQTAFDNTTATFTYINSTMRGYYGYSYGCSATPAVFFHSTKQKVSVGLQFVNFQIETYNLFMQNVSATFPNGAVSFKHMVNDCVPTFSVGSWMSIISAIVLAAVFLFGFLMLNSVQTMDRFDDPKQKQIVINTKE